MADPRQVTEPGETIYVPGPSWAPVFLAVGILGLVAGVFASGFIFNPFIYAIVGALIALGAFRALVRGASASYFRLPRRQRVRSAALPIEPITFPPRD
jgi:hypothetical protein